MTAFIKKEIMEYVRTKKFLIMLVVFLVLAIMSPLFAKLTPEILKMVDIDASALNLSNPTAFESYEQFFKNIGQMGLIIMVIIYSGIMANEFSKGTLINILTKGVKRDSIIYSKYIVSSLMWIVILAISYFIFYGYTAYYFDISVINNSGFTLFNLTMFGIMLISSIILGGTIFKNTIGSLIIPLVFDGILLVLSLFSTLERYNPISLTTLNMSLVKGEIEPSYLYPALIVAVVITILNIAVSSILFSLSEIKQ